MDKGAVWFSNPSNFNDPYDSAAVFFSDFMPPNWRDEMIKVNTTKFELKQLDIMIKEREARLHEDFVKRVRENIRVCCFTENKDSVLMWSHYADQHKGICVEYDLSSLHADDLRLKWVYPVVYSKIVLDASQHLQPETLNPYVFMLASMHKSSVWSYEKEWRMIISNGIMPKEDYIVMPAPTAIYMGSRIDQNVNIYLAEFCHRNKIKMFRGYFERAKFKMSFTEIPLVH